MKRVLLVGLLLSGSWSVWAQSGNVVELVKESVKAGSAKELAKHLDASVDVTINGKPETYSRAQAEFVLRDFFKANPPSEFTIIHQGQSKGGQPFAIGQYRSGSNAFRVWMKIKVSGNQSLVQEISFTSIKE
ncbi:DUF4783 domain-containing protein [Oscillatoria amoena NRMC-F 0135]|jgi:hypothetical protein|nr:DUF4783 domain-containing protein [Oscillatoria amoena NRMC-F 0135]